MDGWRKIADASKYAGVSPRTFREWLKNGLRHVRIPSGTILVKCEWIDSYLQQFEAGQADQIEQIVNEVLKDY